MNENEKSTTYAARVYHRTIAMADHPELFPGNKLSPGLREDLEQLKYKVNIRLENMKTKESLLLATSTYINDCLGCEMSTLESKAKKEKSQQIVVSFPDELLNHKILTACCGDFHTIVLSKGSTLYPGSGKEITDVYGFGQNIYGQAIADAKPKHVTRPTIVPFFVGKQVKLIDAKGSRSVAVCESGDIYEWGFPDITVRKIGYLEVLFHIETQHRVSWQLK